MTAPKTTSGGCPGLFAQFAYPPNELGYCGPPGALLRDGKLPAAVAREFDGAWPYLRAIADAVGITDPLDPDVVRSYWIGGPELQKVDSRELLGRLRAAFSGQVTGLLDDVDDDTPVLAHHSFHVFVVYPWVRFLDRDPVTPLRVLQQCRIRWGTVISVIDEYAHIESDPLVAEAGRLTLGAPAAERVRWSRDGTALTAAPAAGDVVAAHWDWICGPLTDTERTALRTATQATLDLVNAVKNRC